MKNSQSQNDKKGSRLKETSRDHLVQPFVESRLYQGLAKSRLEYVH